MASSADATTDRRGRVRVAVTGMGIKAPAGLTLDDVLSRRTRATIQRAHATMAAAAAIANLIAPDMGWGDREAAEQVARYTGSSQKELLTAGLDLP